MSQLEPKPERTDAERSMEDVVESVMFEDEPAPLPEGPVPAPSPGFAEPPQPLELVSSEPLLQEPPESEPESESGGPAETEAQIAASIAQAIAAAYAERPVHVLTPEEIAQEEGESEPEALQEPAPETAAGEPEPETPPEEPPEETPSEEPAERDSEEPEDKPQKKRRERRRKRQKTPDAPAYNSREVHQRIPRGRVRSGLTDSLALMLSDLRARQQQDLPDPRASLHSRESYYARLTGLAGMLSPLRYLLILLMSLSLLGRRYSFLLLGFLGGRTGIYAAVVFTVLAMGLSWLSVIRAVRDMLYLRFSFESLLLVTTALSLVEAVATGNTMTLLPLLGIGWCLAGTAELMSMRGKLRSLRNVLTGRHMTAVRMAPGMYQHEDCIGRASVGTSGFVRHQERTDTLHAGWSVYGMILLLASLVLGAYLSARTAGNYLTILTTLLTASLPVSVLLCCARPWDLLSRVLGKKGALAGWFGIKVLSGKKIMLVYDADLFPRGTVLHKGVKVYGKQTPQLLVSYGASLMLRAGGGFTEPFTQLLQEVGGKVHHVSYLQLSEGGVTGQIHGVFVAVGTYNFMQLMGTVMPQYAPRNGLFIALNGEIAGLFAIHYKLRAGAAQSFARLVRERRLTLVAATRNLSVNPSFMETWFQIPLGEILCPKVDTRRKLAQRSRMRRGVTCGFVGGDDILPYGRMVAGARRTHRMGLIFTIGSVVLSLGMLIWTVRAIAAGAPTVSGTALFGIQVVIFLLEELYARFAVR